VTVIFMARAKKILSLLLAAILLFAAGGCTDLANVLEENTDLGEEEPSPTASASSSSEPVYGGSISLAVYGLDTSDPIMTKSESYKNLVPLVYEGLVSVKQNLTVSMCLAERYERSADGKKYTVYLKDEVTFHDGSAFSAKDVDYTVKHIMESENPYSKSLSHVVKSYAKGNTYVFELDQPDFGFVNNLDFPILKNKSVTDGKIFVPGTGMYKVEKSGASGDIVLRANGAWHGGKQPYLDEMVWVRLPDRDAAAFALDAKEISAIGSYAVDFVSYSPKANVSMKPVSTGNLCFIGFNHKNVYLSKQLVRWCIEASIDKEKIAREILLGKCAVTNLPYFKDAFYHDSALGASRLDIAKADNILEMDLIPREGKNVPVFRVLAPSTDSIKVNTAHAVVAMLQARGLRAEVDSREYEAYLQAITQGDYDLFIGEMKLEKSGDLTSLLGEGNPFFYQNEGMNSALSKISASASEEEAIQNYAQLSELFLKECPFVPLFLRQEALIYDSRIAGDKNTTGFNYYAGIESWYFQ
jgi:peptide/nickel transport system substrate-binding protein